MNYYIKNVIQPTTKNAPSNKAVIGRYILPKKFFKVIKAKAEQGGKYILQTQYNH